MNRKNLMAVLVAAAVFLPCAEGFAQKVKKLHLKQDDAQPYMVSKVYELKYMKADDLTPFVLGAVKRYDIQSQVERLNYKFKKEQYLVVSTAREMMPYVDDMIAKLDRPGKKDDLGSLIEGTGIFRYSYRPRYRFTEEMVVLLNTAVKSGDGQIYRNPESNIIYWKDSPSDSADILTWVQRFDRPIPQVNLSINVYQVRESTLRDIGIDYLAWKNGPGLNFFGAGLDMFDFLSSDSITTNLSQTAMDAFSNISYGFGGFFVAPQFDMSFVRALQQSGNAKLAATANLTVINNELGNYTVKFSPQYQNIIKSNNDQSTVVIGGDANFSLNIKSPIICFQSPEKNIGKDGQYEFSKKAYEQLLSGVIIFNYNVFMSSVVERNNQGDELVEASNVSSDLTLEFKNEKMLASWTQDSETEETIGIPYLCEIPYVKYLFGTTTTVKEKTFFIVSAKAELLHPESSLVPFAGKVISAYDMAKTDTAFRGESPEVTKVPVKPADVNADNKK
jgi:hypothetical protein